jgi:A/G-specific adenine glycosylase
VARILAWFGGRRLTAKEAQAGADALAPMGEAWAWNQAIMDLGAQRCRPRSPRCDGCPLAPWCQWRAAGHPMPDPAIGSAHVSGGQSPFTGSDRQGRGRLVAALRRAPVAAPELASAMGWPGDPERAERVAATLVADGLAVREADGTVGLS